ncbi:unnamed protein product [Urochloa humidicola]
MARELLPVVDMRSLSQSDLDAVAPQSCPDAPAPATQDQPRRLQRERRLQEADLLPPPPQRRRCRLPIPLVPIHPPQLCAAVRRARRTRQQTRRLPPPPPHRPRGPLAPSPSRDPNP